MALRGPIPILAAAGAALLELSAGVLVFFRPADLETRTAQRGFCDNLLGIPRENATCRSFGGCHGYCPKNACQCISQCINFGNCCPDFLHHCLKESHRQELLLEEEEHLEEIERGQGIHGAEWLLCMVMVCFVLTTMALLCMVNSKIHGVQDAERQLSCTTVSIFAASTFSIALHGVLIEQLWMGKHPGLNRSAGPLIQAKLYAVISVLFHVFSTCVIYSSRDSQAGWCRQRQEAGGSCSKCGGWLFGSEIRYWSFAAAQLSGHITAFLLIRSLGSLQQSLKESRLKCQLVLPWVAVLLRMVLSLAKLVRSYFIDEEDVQWQYVSNDLRWEPYDAKKNGQIEQRHRAMMEENRRSAYTPLEGEEPDSHIELHQPELGGFCMSEYWSMLEHDDEEQPDSNPLSGSVWSFFRCSPPKQQAEGPAEVERWRQVRRFCQWDHVAQQATVDATTIVMGFLIMQSVLFLHTDHLHPIEGVLVRPEDELLAGWMLLWSMFFAGLVAAVTILEQHMTGVCTPTNFEFARGMCSAAMGWCLVTAFAMYARRSSTWLGTYISVAFPLTWLGFLLTGLIYSFAERWKMRGSAQLLGGSSNRADASCHTDKVGTMLQSVAQAFAIPVGIAWDKAFESVIMLATQGWNGHYVISKVILASIVLVAVVPPWFWYLVPRAHGAH